MPEPGPALYVHGGALDTVRYPESSPFKTERAARSLALLQSMHLIEDGQVIAPDPATDAEILRFHTPEYLAALKLAAEETYTPAMGEMGLGSPDCPLFKGLLTYVRAAVGGTLTGARAILEGRARRVFNPSGGYHHAHAGRAGGFCYVNDIVLAADLFRRHGRRVLVLDIDGHHGDGVQDAFYDTAEVMTVSFHESGDTQFPGTGWEWESGTGAGAGFNINLPLPPRTHDAIYLHAFNELALPLIRAFAPDVLIVELGMDALAGDPLVHLALTNNVFADIVERLVTLPCPLLATGGGGYHIANTARGWALMWSILAGHGSHEEATWGMGGIMLESTDWRGGLRDRIRPAEVSDVVDGVIMKRIKWLKENVLACDRV